MRRISKGPDQLGSEYEVVVVGSGYGGGVAAARLARAGRHVCVLERGRELVPGEYPDTLEGANGEVQIDAEDGLIGSPVALYDLRLNPEVNVFVGCGLGGTSLINANVALEMDARQFEEESWPAALVPEKGRPLPLADFYETARRVLGSTPYPERYPKLHKLEALRMGAEATGHGDRFYRPPINVTFEDRVNAFGVRQPACTNCGDCCSGCNVGSKNTTLMNYLPDAHSHGADLFTRCRVEHIERDGGRWALKVRTFTPTGEALGEAIVQADLVVLAAGALGSTEILLRSRERGLPLSPALGRCFSGNGDVLAFGYDCYWQNADGTRPASEDLLDGIIRRLIEAATGRGASRPGAPEKLDPKPVYGIGVGKNDVPAHAWPGPCIAGIIDLRHPSDPERRLVVEEGVIPGGLASVLAPAFFFGDVLRGNPGLYGPQEEAARLADAQRLANAIVTAPTGLADLCYHGPTARTQTYLVMSDDDAGGTLRLGPGGRVRVDWRDAGRSPAIEHDNRVLEQINLAVQGQFLPNPLWSEPFGRQLITVHPVGGCRMSDDPAEGVVNDRCQVFDGTGAGELHEGLYVCDGSVMPGAVGVNPLLTITAVAERAMKLLCEDRGWTYDDGAGGGAAAASKRPGAGNLEGPSAGATTPLRGRLGGPDPRGAAGAGGAQKSRQLGDSPPSVGAPRGGGAADGLLRRLLRALAGLLRWLIGLLLRPFLPLLARLGSWLLRKLAASFPDTFSPSLAFSETMRGYVSTEVEADPRPKAQRIAGAYELAYAEGRLKGEAHAMVASFGVYADSAWQLTSDPAHLARLAGSVACPALAERAMTVEDGSLSLLAVAEDAVETWTMTYECRLTGGRDGPLFFHGRKSLHARPGSSLWKDVTRLSVDVYRGDGAHGLPVARGIISLGLADLVRQALSFSSEPVNGVQRWLQRHIPAAFTGLQRIFLGKFAAFFGMTLFRAYGGLMADLADFEGLEDEQARRHRRRIDAPPPVRYGSGRTRAPFALTRYRGGQKGPVILAPGFSVAASSFATPTVERNLVEVLTDARYDVWLFDYQASPDSGHATRPFDIDDIVDQWRRAIGFVRARAGAESVQAIAHCMGSMTLLMALLDPDGDPLPVRSAICSQTTLHPVTSWLNYVKADIGLAQIVEGETGVVDLRTLDPREGSGGKRKKAVAAAKALDTVLWSVPVPPGEECTNPVCHRVTALYGPSWRHAQLGHETHIALREWFGRVSTRPFRQLSEIMRREYPVSAAGEDRYLPHVARLKLPLTLIAGSANEIFLPETSRRTYEWLCAHNGPELYRRRVFDGYAHMDCFVGRHAARDIFPYLVAELERFN